MFAGAYSIHGYVQDIFPNLYIIQNDVIIYFICDRDKDY